MTPTSTPAVGTGLRLRGITKRFGDLVANNSIDLDITPGEIHCLLGENGAGKSTLMNVLYGLLQPDEGTISIDGVEHAHETPKEAIAAGIGMVHQHFMLVEIFTVAENLILGREDSTAGLLNMGQARQHRPATVGTLWPGRRPRGADRRSSGRRPAASRDLESPGQ